MQPPGLLASCPLFFDPPFVLLLALLGVALGRRLLVLLCAAAGETTVLERLVIAAALGLGALQSLPFALGATGQLSRTGIVVGLTVLALLLGRDLRSVLVSAWRHVRPDRLPRGWLAAGWACFAVFWLLLLLACLSPPTDIDGIYYHLTAPKRWLQSGDLRYLPTLLQTNLPMGQEMLFTICLSLWTDTSAKLVHFALGIFSVLSVFALGRRLHGEAVGFAAAAVWFFGFPKLDTLDASRLMTYAYIDLGLAHQVVAAMLAFAVWFRTRERGWLYAAALCGGFAGTFKLTAVATGFCVSLTAWAASRQDAGQPRRELVLRCVALSLLPILPWVARTWVVTGNPFYPMFASFISSRDWSPEAGRAFEDFFKFYVWGTASEVSLSLAARKAIRLAALGLALFGGALWIWRARRFEDRALLGVFTVTALLGIWGTGLYLRYLVPVLPLLYLQVLAPLGKLLLRSRIAQAALLLLFCLNGVYSLRDSGFRAFEAARTAMGHISREAYLQKKLKVTDLWAKLNKEARSGSKVLLAAGRPSYYIDPYCYVTEAIYQARIPFRDYGEFARTVEREGIEFLVVSTKRPPSFPAPDYAPIRNEWIFCRRLSEERGQLLYRSHKDELYRLNPTDGGGQGAP